MLEQQLRHEEHPVEVGTLTLGSSPHPPQYPLLCHESVWENYWSR